MQIAYCLFPFLLGNLQLSAQQDPLFSQYIFNRLLINPGYAGSTNTLNGTLAYRRQFVGFEGAPQVQALTIYAPVQSKSMGLGLKAVHEKIGVTRQNSVSGIYTYHLRLAKGKLAFGVEWGIFNQSIDFSKLRRTDQDDNAIPLGKENVLVPDAAFGIYYYTEKLYLGGATYHLLQNKLNYSGYTGDDRALIAKLSNHAYLTSGYTFNAGEKIWLEPSLLLKYVAGAPLQIDLNTSATFKDALTIGGAYRTTGNAVIFFFQYNFKDRIKFGYAYDYIFSELAPYNNGSQEIMLSYNLPAKKKSQEIEIDEDMIAEPYYTDTLPEDSLGISIIREEIVFRILICISEEPIFIAPENFKGMENVEEYQEDGLYKYVIDLSYDYDYAKAVLLNQARSNGFNGAIIVAFMEGKRIPVKEALKLLKR